MKINKIAVTKLFGVFDHVIPLNIEDRVTIIIGPNGFGKTVILKMVNSLFNSRYTELSRIPFEELQLDFDNNSCIKVKMVEEVAQNGKGGKNLSLELKFLIDTNQAQIFNLPFLTDEEDARGLMNYINHFRDDLVRIGPETWRNINTDEVLSIEEIRNYLGYELPRGFRNLKTPYWLEELKQNVHVRFIQTERLLSSKNEIPLREWRKVDSRTVGKIAEELKQAIERNLADYAALSQALDRSFPKRLVNQSRSTNLTASEIRERLRTLEEKRTRLTEAGLLDKDQETDFQVSTGIEVENANVLTVYVGDVEYKLSVFDEIAAKIELFTQIINKRFQYKQIKVSKDNGFTINAANGKAISPASLSSGEQHELVLLYELLFKVKPGSLILIDEPEISLHVAWQVEFLKDLLEITKLAGIDVLLATHSPDIIGNRWDLTVELKGPVQGPAQGPAQVEELILETVSNR